MTKTTDNVVSVLFGPRTKGTKKKIIGVSMLVLMKPDSSLWRRFTGSRSDLVQMRYAPEPEKKI